MYKKIEELYKKQSPFNKIKARTEKLVKEVIEELDMNKR